MTPTAVRRTGSSPCRSPVTSWPATYASTPSSPSSRPKVREEDVTRLSPLKHRNLNLLGRYSFTASTPAADALRPLRDPDAPELDEDDEGVD